MAVAAYRIWMKGKSGADVQKALVLYCIQLFLNFLWSIIFFRFRLYAIAFLELLLLLVYILLTTFEFYRIDKISALPYDSIYCLGIFCWSFKLCYMDDELNF